MSRIPCFGAEVPSMRDQGIALRTSFDRASSLPTEFSAATAKYQVPGASPTVLCRVVAPLTAIAFV